MVLEQCIVLRMLVHLHSSGSCPGHQVACAHSYMGPAAALTKMDSSAPLRSAWGLALAARSRAWR